MIEVSQPLEFEPTWWDPDGRVLAQHMQETSNSVRFEHGGRCIEIIPAGENMQDGFVISWGRASDELKFRACLLMSTEELIAAFSCEPGFRLNWDGEEERCAAEYGATELRRAKFMRRGSYLTVPIPCMQNDINPCCVSLFLTPNIFTALIELSRRVFPERSSTPAA